MERYTWVRFAGKLTPCHTHSHGNGQHTSGAMEEMSRGFKMQTLTSCDATFMSTRTAAGQFKGHSSRGQWRKCLGRFKTQALTDCDARAQQPVSLRASSRGQWRKCLGKGRRRAHPGCLIRVDVGVGQCCRARDVESPTLRAKRTSA